MDKRLVGAGERTIKQMNKIVLKLVELIIIGQTYNNLDKKTIRRQINLNKSRDIENGYKINIKIMGLVNSNANPR